MIFQTTFFSQNNVASVTVCKFVCTCTFTIFVVDQHRILYCSFTGIESEITIGISTENSNTSIYTDKNARGPTKNFKSIYFAISRRRVTIEDNLFSNRDLVSGELQTLHIFIAASLFRAAS